MTVGVFALRAGLSRLPKFRRSVSCELPFTSASEVPDARPAFDLDESVPDADASPPLDAVPRRHGSMDDADIRPAVWYHHGLFSSNSRRKRDNCRAQLN